MRKRLLPSTDNVANILTEQGIKGLSHATGKAFKLYCHRAFIKNQILRGALSGIFRREISNPRPVLAYLDLTNKCNLSCKMCTWKKNQEKIGYMPQSLFESCVDQLSELGFETLYLYFGGESLLHPKFKDFLTYAIYRRDHGGIQSVAWVDNGMLFDQSIADLVIDLKVDEVNFSIDGVGEVNDKIRLGSKYYVIERNIKYLIAKRGKAIKPKVTIGVVDYGKTEDQKMDIFREWAPFVDWINLIPFIQSDNSWGNKNDFSRGQIAKPPDFCPVPFYMMVVSWNGKVTGCCFDYSCNLKLGDATKESLKQIWRGSRFQAFRTSVLTRTYPVGSLCQKCEFWKVNFEPAEKDILNGRAIMKYGYRYRVVRKKADNSSVRAQYTRF